MSAFTVTNAKPVTVDIHPPSIFRAEGPQAGKASGGGAWRGVRCTLTGPASYDAGGSALPALPGIKRVESLLVVGTDDAVANADGNALRMVTAEAQPNVKVFTSANVEVAGAVVLSGASWEVIILGR